MALPSNEPSRRDRAREALLAWFRANDPGYPWRWTHDPFAVLVSEIMLQQTQASRVVEAFPAFMQIVPRRASARGRVACRRPPRMGWPRLRAPGRVLAGRGPVHRPRPGRRGPLRPPHVARAPGGRALHRIRRLVDRVRRAGRRRRHERPQGDGQGCVRPRTRRGPGGRRRRRGGPVAPAGGSGRLEPSGDGSGTGRVPSRSALRRVSARHGVPVPGERPSGASERSPPAGVRRLHAPGARGSVARAPRSRPRCDDPGDRRGARGMRCRASTWRSTRSSATVWWSGPPRAVSAWLADRRIQHR